MKILVLGADGYLGWPTAMHFSAQGHQVIALDNFAKRQWELEEGIEPLIPVPPLHRRIRTWEKITGKKIHLRIGDLCNHRFIYNVLSEEKPDAIVHYAEQPSAPYSMQSRTTAAYTQSNNIIGTLNLMFAMHKYCPQAHLIKLGTMGEYGTPNIDIEEGWITIEHNGRSDTVLYPKRPGSFYHLSKVADSQNLEFGCRIWKLRCTDLNQGVVYGIHTEQTVLDSDLRTSFHYDEVFGTVLNRFIVQAVAGYPLSVYGRGGQTRGFLNIVDTIKCVDLAAKHPAEAGEFRVYNQFTEQFSVLQLAEKVQIVAKNLNYNVEINKLPNPRIELEEHYYNAKHKKLEDLGLKPTYLSDLILEKIFTEIKSSHKNIHSDAFIPKIKWAQI